jgi:hypothetical protein
MTLLTSLICSSCPSPNLICKVSFSITHSKDLLSHFMMITIQKIFWSRMSVLLIITWISRITSINQFSQLIKARFVILRITKIWMMKAFFLQRGLRKIQKKIQLKEKLLQFLKQVPILTEIIFWLIKILNNIS